MCRVSDARRNLLEVVRALCVLALLFLNFGHTQSAWPVAYTGDLTPYLVSSQALDEVCKQTGQDNPQSHHTPCHACRIGAGADLPPVPCLMAPAFVATRAVAYARPLERIAPRPQARIHGPRAPPLA